MKTYIHRMTGLSIQVAADVGSGFVARVLELPGCVSQGESENEALESVEDAMVLMLEVIHEDNRPLYERLLGWRTTSALEARSSVAPESASNTTAPGKWFGGGCQSTT